MSPESRRAARARLALRSTARQQLFDPQNRVTMIDYGIPIRSGSADTDPTLRFHVQQKRSTPELESLGIPLIPRQIGEFTTDVIEGSYRPHAGLPTQRQNPLCGGSSISDILHLSAGTLGCLVRDRLTGQPMILSNWHVLVVEWFSRVGKPICQPGRLDGGDARDIVATLTRHAMQHHIDAAVATLNGVRQLSTKQLGLGEVSGIAEPQLGMQVVKAGRTTGITKAFVSGVDGEARINYRGIIRGIRHVVTLSPQNGGEVSAPGDSGSCWMEQATNRAIGLHFAGSNSPETGLAIAMQPVLDALNIDLLISQPVRLPAARQHHRQANVAL
jgi:hypothetical protein